MPTKLRQLGYTLIGMAMTLAVVGLMAGVGASRYTIYYREKTVDDTRGNVNIVVEYLLRYLNQNGYYPCPARLNVANDNDNYGMPIDNCNTVTYTDLNTNGFILELGSGGGRVLRGAVPFRVLNLPQSVVKDAYNMRLEYVVTGVLTDKRTYSNTGGNIEVVGSSLTNTILPISGKAHLVVLSHGRDRAGASSDEGGINVVPCSVGTKDAENCNGDAKYRLMPLADLGTDNPSHFDDYLAVSMAPNLPMWLIDSENNNNIWYDTSLAPTLAIGYTANETPNFIGKSYKTITDASNSSPLAVTTSANHGYKTDDVVFISGSDMTEINGRYYRVETTATPTIFNLKDMLGNYIDGSSFPSSATNGKVYKLYTYSRTPLSEVSIDEITMGNPVEVSTLASHGYSTGDVVFVSGVSDMTEINENYYRIVSTGPSTFELQDISGTNINGTDFSAIGTGGTATKYSTNINLSVNGELKTDGNVYTQYLCDASVNDRYSSSNMSYCVKIDDLYPAADWSCPAGSYVSSIDTYGDSGFRMYCATSAGMEYRCPAGKVMIGLTSSDIVCGYPPKASSPTSSTASSISNYCENKIPSYMCSESSMGAAITAGTTFAVGSDFEIGVSLEDSDYKEKYKCIDREWVLTEKSGYCDGDNNGGDGIINNICSDSTPFLYSDSKGYSAFAFYNNIGSDGSKSGFKGFWDVAVSNICVDDYTSIAQSPGANLICNQGEVKKIYASCPSGQEGYVEKTMEWRCAPPTEGWVETSSNDYCVAIKKLSSNHCPEGLVDSDGNGSCDTCVAETQTRTRNVSCITGAMKTCTIIETRTMDCSGVLPKQSRKWSPWRRSGSDVAVAKKWQHGATTTPPTIGTAIGPIKDRGSVNRLGETCYENPGVQRACYAPAGHGTLDGLPLYYQYKDCICQ